MATLLTVILAFLRGMGLVPPCEFTQLRFRIFIFALIILEANDSKYDEYYSKYNIYIYIYITWAS